MYWFLFIAKFGAGILLPGFLLGRLIGSKAPWLTAFLASCAFLFELVLIMDACRIPVAVDTVSLGLMVFTLVLIGLNLRQKKREVPVAAPRKSDESSGSRGRYFWIVPLVFGLGAIAVRSVLDPLSGYDNGFRWDHLAHQLVRLQSLHFYPAVSADDFLHYAWCDGIPPLVPVLNFWAYASAAAEQTWLTIPRVLLEAGLLFYSTWLLAGRLGGKSASPIATAILATCSLALWAVSIGQETGLTAITLVAMYIFLTDYEKSQARADLFWAGLAAGVGGLSREYGLAWLLLGLFTLWLRGNLKAGWKIFALTAVVISAPWYVRNWVHTGNPLFSYSLAGIFPVNSVHQRIMQGIQSYFWNLLSWPFASFALASLVVAVGPLLALALVLIRRLKRPAAGVFTGLILVIALWAWSVPQTAGGWIYAMRVLSPALALGAALTGAWLAQVGGKRQWILLAITIMGSADAAMRSWVLPNNPLVAPWNLSFSAWRESRRLSEARETSPLWREIARIAGDRAIVVDHPGHHQVLNAWGVRAIPLQSPALAAIFDPSLTYPAVLTSLRAEGVRFVLLTPGSMSAENLIKETPFLSNLRQRESPVLDNRELLMFDLDSIGAK